MPEFITLSPPDIALDDFLKEIHVETGSEIVPSESALGKVLAKSVRAPYSLPSFRRSTVDGYAVIGANTHGASSSLPAYLKLRGEVPMGGTPDFELGKGECALIHTGGMLPAVSDAVVMIENTQIASGDEIEILKAVAQGENVIQIGEDVKAGEEVIPVGRKLRPAEIGGLMALGITEVEIVKPPKVGILSTGDEVITPGEEILPGQVNDINSYTLAGLVEDAGGTPMLYGIIPDDFEQVYSTARKAHQECDIVVITAGSSASVRDLTSKVIDALGKPGVLVHGVNIRPGKPTILAICDGKPVIGLPGNPVSALVVARLFVVDAVEKLLNLHAAVRLPSTKAKLAVNLSSMSGREDWVAVKLVEDAGEVWADPVFGKSNLIFSLIKADGLVRIAPDATGLSSGEIVEVWPF